MSNIKCFKFKKALCRFEVKNISSVGWTDFSTCITNLKDCKMFIALNRQYPGTELLCSKMFFCTRVQEKN